MSEILQTVEAALMDITELGILFRVLSVLINASAATQRPLAILAS